MSDLIKRLRGKYSVGPDGVYEDRDFGSFTPAITNEAADRIEQLKKENEELKDALIIVSNASDWFLSVYDDSAFDLAKRIIKQAMIDDNPEKVGSYAHSWHCNIAMMCYDAMSDAASKTDEPFNHGDAHKIANDAASRFMKLCFNVETKQR